LEGRSFHVKKGAAMTILAVCRCGHRHELPEPFAGKKIKCQACKEVLTVPGLSDCAPSSIQAGAVMAKTTDGILGQVASRPSPPAQTARPPSPAQPLAVPPGATAPSMISHSGGSLPGEAAQAILPTPPVVAAPPKNPESPTLPDWVRESVAQVPAA